MAEEIQEAIQIIRVAYDGVEICMKAGCSGLKALQQIVQLFKYLLDQEKLSGKTSMKKLLMRGGDLQVLKFSEQDLKRIEKAAKKYGILYTAGYQCKGWICRDSVPFGSSPTGQFVD